MEIEIETQQDCYIETNFLVQKKIIKQSLNESKVFTKVILLKKQNVTAEIKINDTTYNIPIDQIIIKTNEASIDINDMITISQINKVDLLNNLQNRYKRNQIHTYVGETLLITNPFQNLDIYNNKIKNNYIYYYRKIKDSADIQQPDPHIFFTVMKMIDNLLTEKDSSGSCNFWRIRLRQN
jgi:myosin heavy subunit